MAARTSRSALPLIVHVAPQAAASARTHDHKEIFEPRNLASGLDSLVAGDPEIANRFCFAEKLAESRLEHSRYAGDWSQWQTEKSQESQEGPCPGSRQRRKSLERSLKAQFLFCWLLENYRLPTFALQMSANGFNSPGRRRQRLRLTEEQEKELKEAFDLFDIRQTNSIDYHELKVCMRALGFPVTKDEVIEMASEYDVQGTGRVEYKEFIEIMTFKITNRDPSEEIQKAFQLFDEERTGKISLRNLRRIAKELGENLDEAELAAMIDEFDQNLDGEMENEEFAKIMPQSRS